MFAYCGNNPVMRKDSNGRIWGWLAGAIVGAIVSAVVETVSQVTDYLLTGDPISVGDILTEAAGGAAYGATVALTGSTTAGDVARSATTTVITGIRKNESFEEIAVDTLINATGQAIKGFTGSIVNKNLSGKYARLGKVGEFFKSLTDPPSVGKFTSAKDYAASLAIEGAKKAGKKDLIKNGLEITLNLIFD